MGSTLTIATIIAMNCKSDYVFAVTRRVQGNVQMFMRIHRGCGKGHRFGVVVTGHQLGVVDSMRVAGYP